MFCDFQLKQITSENGIRHYEKGEKRIRQQYRAYLAAGIRLGLETGQRRDASISMKFSDIIENSDGTPEHIKVEDFKVNRIQNRTRDEEKNNTI